MLKNKLAENKQTEHGAETQNILKVGDENSSAF